MRFAAAASGAQLEGRIAEAARAQRERRVPASAADALLASGAASDNRSALLEGRALAITTGQQAGLFTGPLYAVLKGLSAAALAERLSGQTGRPVVPVFWVAGDDHDFAEVNHCEVTAADGHPARIVLRERGGDAPMRPVFREPVGPEGAAALGALHAALPPSEFRDEALAWLSRAYAPGRSLAEACAQALSELLAPFGVVVCRGWHGSLKAAAREVAAAALERAAELDRALADEARRLRDSGAATPVEVGDGLSLLMIEGRLGRDRLRPSGDGTMTTRRSGESFTVAQLLEIAGREPERLSANVLLRPAVESFVIPTVCYVGGPAELDYLRQAGPVFEHVGSPRPARAPRLSGFVIESRVERTLERLNLEPADLAAPEGELAGRLARTDLPPAVREALDRLREDLASRYTALGASVREVDPTLEKTVESARNQAFVAASDIEKRLVHARKRQQETVASQLSRAREALYPGGRPQERVITVVSFLARHGPVLMDALYAAAREHAARLLEAPPPQP